MSWRREVTRGYCKEHESNNKEREMKKNAKTTGKRGKKLAAAKKLQATKPLESLSFSYGSVGVTYKPQ